MDEPAEPQVDIRLWSRFTRGISAVLLAAGLTVGGLLTFLSIQKQKTHWDNFLSLRGRTLSRALGRAAFVPLLLEDRPALETLTEGFAGEIYVSYVAVYTADGAQLSRRPLGPEESLDRLPNDMTETRLASSEGPAVRDFVMPLRYGAAAGAAPGDRAGYVRVGLTEERVEREIRASIIHDAAACAGVTLAAFLAGALLLRRMTRQMREMILQVQSAAELKRTNKELEAFSYSVSHDLRSPLRAINGFSQVVMEDYGDRLDETGRGHLQRVRDGCARMGQLIDDLLALSRVVRQEMRRERVDLTAEARAVAERLAQAEPERRVVFSADEGAVTHGDPGLLRIVLENLLGNAWKFTRKMPAARVSFESVDKDGARTFCVRDNGAGFDMAYAGKLFGTFQRLHDAAEFPGTGIGLATVQRIIQRHGGRIWAESAPGQGAAFYFSLPERTAARRPPEV